MQVLTASWAKKCDDVTRLANMAAKNNMSPSDSRWGAHLYNEHESYASAYASRPAAFPHRSQPRIESLGNAYWALHLTWVRNTAYAVDPSKSHPHTLHR